MNTSRKLLSIILVAVSSNNAISQGIVNFFNQPMGPTKRVFDVNVATPLSGTNFIAQLLYQDNTGAWVAHPTTARFFDSSMANVAGYWFGGMRTLSNAGGVPDPGNPTYALPVNMQVRVWDGGSGNPLALTFDEAVLAGMKWGTSTPFVYREEYDLGSDDKWMKNFQSFSLVPEPSAWALFALGMGWLFWRSRKHRMSDAS